MLIRIVDHFRNNPKRIDKLIAVKGLPEEWLYFEGPEGRELRRPWQPDIDANIPRDLRHLCDEQYFVFRYPPIEKGASWVIEKRKVSGIKIDYNTEPGREMWDQVERFIEESIPRNERIPVPVVCAKDERSAFETYTPRRTPTGSLEFVPSTVPEVDLTRYKVQETMIQAPPVPVAAPAVEPKKEIAREQPPIFACPVCSKSFFKERALWMHKMKAHPKEEKVGVA